MEMHQIRYFLTVAETLNFTRAAEQCHVAQPSLTRAIKKLEAELGGDLFHREGRRTHMTDLGRMMQPLLAQSFESAITAKEQAESYGKADIAHLRLGLSKSVSPHAVEAVLREMIRVMPNLEISIARSTATEIEKYLESGDVDVAVSANDAMGWDRLVHWPLFSEHFVVALNSEHCLAGRPVLRMRDLDGQDMVNRIYCEASQDLSAVFDKRHVQARHSHSVNSEIDLEFLLSNNLGVSVVPETIQFHDRDLVKLELEDLQFERRLYLLAVAGRRHTKPVKLFISLLRTRDWSIRQ